MSRWISEAPLDAEAVASEVEDLGSGAVVTFAGTVRNEHAGRSVRAMTYEAHVPLAEKALRALEEEVVARFDVRRCRIRHRVGTLQLGEPSVVIAVAAAHRAEAFEAARYAIDELKRRAPIWKEEHYEGGESRFLDGVPLKSGNE